MPRSLRTFACLFITGIFVIDNPYCGTRDYDQAQLALAYLENERYEQALKEITRALRQRGDNPDFYLIAAMAHLGKEEIEEAAQALGKGLLVSPDDVRLHQTLRDICQQYGRFTTACSILEELLDRHPDNPRIQAGLGWAYAQLQEEEKAVDLLSRAIDTETSDPFAHVQLSRIYLDQERLEKAAQVLEKALEIAPDDPRPLLALGETRFRQEQADAAADAFAQALERSETPAITATRIARFYYERGLRSRAIEYYERALQFDDSNSLILNNLAWTYAEEGTELERALMLAIRAVKLDDDNVVYLDTYAEVLHLKGQHARAIAVMRRALELEPEDGEQYEYLQNQMAKYRQAAGPGAGASPDL